jgi:RNA-directed DNA polymerase
MSDSLEQSLYGWRRRIASDSSCWRQITIERRGKPRTLRVPCAPLKRVQRAVNTALLAPLDSERASYCRAGRGVLKAVQQHERRPALLHRDIAGFFPAVSARRVVRALLAVGLSRPLAQVISDVCTVDDELPQGAPTSVTLGNLVLQSLDRRLTVLCRQRGLTYTRYVDDLAISGGEQRLTALAPLIDRIIADEGWAVGTQKGGLALPGEYREYLGVSVGGPLRPGRLTAAAYAQLHEDLEAGRIDWLEFRQRTGWITALRRATHVRSNDDSQHLSAASATPVSSERVDLSPVVDSHL